MAKAKFSIGEAVIISHNRIKGFVGDGKVRNIFRSNSRWLYEVEFSAGVRHQYEENAIERKQLHLGEKP